MEQYHLKSLIIIMYTYNKNYTPSLDQGGTTVGDKLTSAVHTISILSMKA